jgi:glucosamine kinase
VAYFLGVDGGGTGCRALICNEHGKHLGSGTSGSANIASDLTGARDNILAATHAALNDAGLSPETINALSAYLGLAGANIDNAAERLSNMLPFQALQIDSDAAISLEGAIGSSDGAAAMIGTGTIFAQRRDGMIILRGGWGFILGDQGGGAWLGRSLLEAALLAHDNIIPHTSLTQKTMERFKDDPQMLVEFAQDAAPADFGRFAPDVFEFGEQDDAVAGDIIDEAVTIIEATLRAMHLRSDEPFCMLGGLGPQYVPYLHASYRAQVQSPLADAVSGAAALAVRRFDTRQA